MITNRKYEVKPREEAKKPPRLRHYTPLIWEQRQVEELKQEPEQKIEVKKSERCVIL